MNSEFINGLFMKRRDALKAFSGLSTMAATTCDGGYNNSFAQ